MDPTRHRTPTPKSPYPLPIPPLPPSLPPPRPLFLDSLGDRVRDKAQTVRAGTLLQSFPTRMYSQKDRSPNSQQLTPRHVTMLCLYAQRRHAEKLPERKRKEAHRDNLPAGGARTTRLTRVDSQIDILSQSFHAEREQPVLPLFYSTLVSCLLFKPFSFRFSFFNFFFLSVDPLSFPETSNIRGCLFLGPDLHSTFVPFHWGYWG